MPPETTTNRETTYLRPGDIAGWIVLIRDDGRPGWHADWDGEVHTSREAGEQARREAQAAGYEAMLTALHPDVPINPEEW